MHAGERHASFLRGLAAGSFREFNPAEEIVLLFIGSRTCGFSNDPSLPGTLQTVVANVRAVVEDRGLRMATAGFAYDAHVEAGLEFLARMGQFDEVSSGRRWLNSAIIDFVWGGVAAYRSTPQIVVIHHRVLNPDHDPQFVAGIQRSVVGRFSGLDEIGRLTDPAFARRVLADIE